MVRVRGTEIVLQKTYGNLGQPRRPAAIFGPLLTRLEIRLGSRENPRMSRQNITLRGKASLGDS
jgi:hypothetical protein